MDYQSTFLWEKGNSQEYNKVSLILQQVMIHRQNVLFACVCESEQEGKEGVLESGYFTEALVEWFHRELIGLVERKAAEKDVEKSLQKEVGRVLEEIRQHAAKCRKKEDLSCKGLLLWESRFWMFSKGSVQAWVINRRFNKKNMHLIGQCGKYDKIVWEAGSIQKRLGLLLCTKGFCEQMEKSDVAEALLPEGETAEERLQKRLRELWQEQARRGCTASAGVIYIRT